jgi:hypothetical protein
MIIKSKTILSHAFSENVLNMTADLQSHRGTHSHLGDTLEHQTEQKVHTQFPGGSHAEA